MSIKDYYSVLQVSASASLHEIKKAYRQLAKQYHPDKHNNDPYKAAQFEQIKEAYETLSSPIKKNHYLQQRWYSQSLGKKNSTNEPVTPHSILKQSLELNRYVATLDIHRMNKEGLVSYICDIISDSTIEQLKKFNEADINKTIIESLLNTMGPLSPSQVKQISIQLFKLAGDDVQHRNSISKALSHLYKKEKIRKLQPLIIILITAIICLLIYFVGR